MNKQIGSGLVIAAVVVLLVLIAGYGYWTLKGPSVAPRAPGDNIGKEMRGMAAEMRAEHSARRQDAAANATR